jgi:multisubunit Na+/H+ antiporter MnhE subunit
MFRWLWKKVLAPALGASLKFLAKVTAWAFQMPVVGFAVGLAVNWLTNKYVPENKYPYLYWTGKTIAGLMMSGAVTGATYELLKDIVRKGFINYGELMESAGVAG